MHICYSLDNVIFQSPEDEIHVCNNMSNVCFIPLTNRIACRVLIDQTSQETHVQVIPRGKQTSHSSNILLLCLKHTFLLRSLYPVALINRVASCRAFHYFVIFVGFFNYQSVLQSSYQFHFRDDQQIEHLLFESNWCWFQQKWKLRRKRLLLGYKQYPQQSMYLGLFDSKQVLFYKDLHFP